jgi:hypothetical protein
MKYWEIIADNLKKRGWSYGYVSAIDSQGRQSGLQTHIATTESVSLSMRMNCNHSAMAGFAA